ncbi:MAG: inositol monophosphatase [Clostridiales bacterium]|nr:inositol monophosphatase [Clostridiales bacterium]
MREALEAVVREAGQMMLSRQEAAVHRKEGHFNFVTERDLQIQEFLRGRLAALLPGSCFFSEEQDNQGLTDAPTWIVDPIDGTINYMRGRRCSAVSVALLHGRRPTLAAVYDPFADEMFTARAGEGCQLNGQPVHVADTPYERALITVGTTPYEPELMRLGMQAAYAVLRQAGDIRRSGSAALDLAWVACGRTDAFFEMRLSPWDFAGGALLVEEAGGKLCDPQHEEIDYGKPSRMLAANPACYQPVLDILRQAQQGRLEAL